MLYLHCGWPRTGTSSLQHALFRNRDRLVATGIVYPQKWRVATGLGMTHRGLVDMLNALPRSHDPFADLKRYLSDHADEDVLLSVEVLTEWLLTESRQQALLALLAASREVVPTRCVWTLRRLDVAISSLRLRPQAVGPETFGSAEQLDRVQPPSALFSGLRLVAEAVDGDAVYVKYDSGGKHNSELLRAFGVPADLVTEIAAEMTAGPRLNTRLTEKQAVALTHLEELSARAGVDLDRVALRKAFYSGALTFEGDRPCELADDRERRILHARALATAKEQGFAPYVEFFSDVEVESGSPARPGLEIITDDDLTRLAACA